MALHFSFSQDFAHATADSATGFANRTNIRKYFYFDRGVNYLLVGVPLSWLDAQPAGDAVIDPTTIVTASNDVWIEDWGKFGSDSSTADVNSSFESTVLFQSGETGSWKSWNLPRGINDSFCRN